MTDCGCDGKVSELVGKVHNHLCPWFVAMRVHETLRDKPFNVAIEECKKELDAYAEHRLSSLEALVGELADITERSIAALGVLGTMLDAAGLAGSDLAKEMKAEAQEVVRRAREWKEKA